MKLQIYREKGITSISQVKRILGDRLDQRVTSNHRALDVKQHWDYTSYGYRNVRAALKFLYSVYPILPAKPSSYKPHEQHRYVKMLHDKQRAKQRLVDLLSGTQFAATLQDMQNDLNESINSSKYGDHGQSAYSTSDGAWIVARHSTIIDEWPENSRYPIKHRETELFVYTAAARAKSLRIGAAPLKPAKTVLVSSRTGNYIANAMIELLNPRSGKANHINLNPKIRAKRVGKRFGVDIYMRTIAGEPLDYVAVHGKKTYHDSTKHAAMRGLIDKIHSSAYRSDRINYKKAMSLGFCTTGINEFCGTFGLDVRRTYKKSYIRTIVADDTRAELYRAELKTAGIIG